jgi:hypothetical protein
MAIEVSDGTRTLAGAELTVTSMMGLVTKSLTAIRELQWGVEPDQGDDPGGG